ncbi:MAG: type II toxin-antitoxin system VapC family toxin [Thermovenabulum sp.]|uniref:type II toxin-antitoxin system VapC family toxin n=1 Tax=Thermovenabulum sp. TaxID=3100335 RepID=UPI003C7D425F
MTDKYLVDTSIWIESLKRNGDINIQQWMKKALLEERVVITPIIKIEILSGAISEKQFFELKEELDSLTILDNKPELWEKTAYLNFILRRKGFNVPLTDVLISTWALIYDCVLVHQDRHYEMIKEIERNLKTLNFLT